MGPPRERDGELEAVGTAIGAEKALLQWGRRVNATESSDAATSPTRTLRRLQWGRRVNATERPYPNPGVTDGTLLQWGRRVNATESLSNLFTQHGLNMLQWGRRVNATESAPSGTRRARHALASMGPPRERDGEPLKIEVSPNGRTNHRFNGAAA